MTEENPQGHVPPVRGSSGAEAGEAPGGVDAAVGTEERDGELAAGDEAGDNEGRIPGLAREDEDGRPRHRVLRRMLIGAGVLALIIALLVGGALWFVTARYAGNIDRISGVFGGLDEKERPAPATPQGPGAPPVTFLLAGSDTRGHTADGEDPDGRSDAIIIARLSGDRRHTQLISIPRDSWVEIPGHGMNKINASYAFGGPTLLIQTIEQLTNVRIDHYVAIDFDGIAEVTDALGGVDVLVAETTSNGPYTFQAGVNHITGEQARWYLGQRYGLPGGDFDRVRRHQQYLQAVFQKLFSQQTFTDLGRLDASLRALTDAVSIDDTLSSTDLLGLAYSARDLTPENVDFFTAPVLGTGMEGPASVVYLDNVSCERMWAYLRSDSLGQNTEEFSKQSLPEVPR